MKQLQEDVNMNDEAEKDRRQCPYCGQTIKAEAKKCRYCKNWLNDEAESISNGNNSPIEQEPTTQYVQTIKDYKPSTVPCPYCGEQILPTAKKCKHCQSWLYGEIENGMSNSNFVPTCEEINWEPIVKGISEFLAGIAVLGILWWLFCLGCDELADFLESFARFLTINGY